jgi:hypothetical protein
VDVLPARQARLVDLDDGADHDELPVRAEPRHCGDQVQIHPLVDDAEVTEPRTRQAGLVVRLGPAALACPREMGLVDA